MSIKRLSKETIKLINSTQVITSIYSVVKELVENALDAEAQNVEVNLVDDGLSLIEVKDNGVGISDEDAKCMALPGHTSKIKYFEDLDLLSTYGFRGEGLSSICLVSEVTVCTKTANDETMRCYNYDHEGNLINSDISHGLTGTVVKVKNLFKKMPVRRNILNKRRLNQEFKATELLLKSFAICKPSVRFVFRLNGKTIFTKPNCISETEAIKNVLGGAMFARLTHEEKNIERITSSYDLQFFFPHKENTDCAEIIQTGFQFICVNGRPIKSKEIEKTILRRINEKFDSNSASRKYVFCLVLQIDPSWLDINLEPNKDKIYITNETMVTDQLDSILVEYYGIEDSQPKAFRFIENESKQNVQEKKKESEMEWQACKKQKTISASEKIVDISDNNAQSKIHSNQQAGKTCKKSDSDFLKTITAPALSDSESNDAEQFQNKFSKSAPSNSTIVEENNGKDSEPFEFASNVQTVLPDNETLSQLPVVDLGEDFDWQEVTSGHKENHKDSTIPKVSENKTHKNDAEQILNTEIKNVVDKPVSTENWSRGQVSGLEGGVSIGVGNANNIPQSKDKEESTLQESELFDFGQVNKQIIDSEEPVVNDELVAEIDSFDWEVKLKNTRNKAPLKKNNTSTGVPKQLRRSLDAHADPTQTKIPFAGDNACLNKMGHSAFSMYCTAERPKILKEYPDLNPTEVAIHLNKQWKMVSIEERDYYRDLAEQNNQNKSQKSCTNVSQASTKSKKSQLSESDKERNSKKLLNMLGNMKSNKAEIKNQSSLMRTFVNWNLNLEILTSRMKIQEKTKVTKRILVGSLNRVLWIIDISSNLFVFSVNELIETLGFAGKDTNSMGKEDVKELIEQWFNEKKDMTIFHPIHSIES